MSEELLQLDRIAAVISAIGFVGILLLLPLYISQRRDLKRLREWMERDPDHPRRDILASEARLDRAERELERIYAERGEPLPDVTAVYPDGLSVEEGSGITAERPALVQLTMEREALQPHRRWRRFSRRMSQPRWLAAIALGAVLLAVGAVALSQVLLQSDDEPAGPGIRGLDPAAISVAVLNATTNAGLAGDAAADVQNAGFTLTETGVLEEQRPESVVMFAPERKALGRKVARDLRIKRVEKMDKAVRREVGSADVAVIVGEDRAKR
ncbi:MAG TPA: LytR C-terminal domain-containing protein [Solirubrobacterales bacterium]